MFKDVHRLSKIAVHIDSDYTAVEGKPVRKARLFKRAISIEKKLLKAVSALMPTAETKEVKKYAGQYVNFIHKRITNKVGRRMKGGLPNV